MATNQATLQKERANNQGKTEVTRKLHRNKERTIWMIVAFMVWNITKEKGPKRIPRTTTKAATIIHSSTSTTKNVLVAMDLKNQENSKKKKSETMKSWPW